MLSLLARSTSVQKLRSDSPRTGIVRHPVSDVARAAADQHVGDRLPDSGSSCNGEQMRLALGSGDGDEVRFGKLPGLCEHRSRHRDIIVVCEAEHHFGRHRAERRQPVRQFGASLDLRPGDQPAEHETEQTKMVVVELARTIEKKRSDAPERLRPFLGGAALDHLFQFRNERGLR
jgi:hypothetical protein